MADPGRFQGPGGLVTQLDSPCASMSQIARAPLPHPHHRRDELWLYLLGWARSYRGSAARLPIVGRRLVVICWIFEPGIYGEAGCVRRFEWRRPRREAHAFEDAARNRRLGDRSNHPHRMAAFDTPGTNPNVQLEGRSLSCRVIDV
jgi:hypothetical protein